MVRRSCMEDPTVAPRWHQDDRGQDNDHRGFHVVADEGMYSAIPVWLSRTWWVHVLAPAVYDLNVGRAKELRVGRDLFLQWALVKSSYANQTTGRHCIVRPDTLASVLDCTPRQVQQLNRFAREVGLEVVVLEGRMLTEEESYGCRRRGSRQRGLSTEVALTVPVGFRRSVDSFTPTSGSSTPQKSHGQTSSLRGLAAEKKGSASPTLLRQKRERRRRVVDLAREVAQGVPWLASERPARLAPTLTRFATAAVPWTAADIVETLAAHNRRTGRDEIDSASIRTRPAAVLASIMRGVDEVSDHPGPAAAFPRQSGSSEPCGGPGCDHGWVELDNGRVAHCPDCPPAVLRMWREDADVVELDQYGEPPF